MMQDFSDIFPLCPSRSHEALGAGAISFALCMIGMSKGPVLWVNERRQNERLHPGGLIQFCDPSRLMFAHGKSHMDVLWIAEEALRSKTVPLVIAQLSADIGLTEGRRLQLAAEAGRTTGLFLLPQDMGSNAAETRWHCMPIYDCSNSDSTLFDWRCIKNKSGTTGRWIVNWNEATHHINLVPQDAQRTRPKAQAG
ncbi:hypothetical protein MNBD_ALPHA11-2221 [hydrothermal vent metagenome]|uniref:Protein ImuA n=1 Tax=hydrothermal vent metagenome TaxID=652676 RepID=A0A3B0TQM6_9ZZZZ